MTGTDHMESLRLQAAIVNIENRLFNSGDSFRSSASMLAKILNDAKHELNSVEATTKQHHDEGRRKAQAEVAAVVYLVARETALNAQEREQYGEFIARDFFTKEDFNKLDKFYVHTWGRLSEGGKSEMSLRVWGGVKRGEYEFVELPGVVKDKEAARLEQILKKGPSWSSSVWEVPETDRNDFMKARDEGQKQESHEVLNRPSFASALGKAKEREVSSETVVTGHEADKLAVSAANTAQAGLPDAQPERAKITQGDKFDIADLGSFSDPVKNAQAAAENEAPLQRR